MDEQRQDPTDQAPGGQSESQTPSPGFQSPPTLAERTRTVFFSRDGLRPGWRFLLFLIIFALLAFSLGELIKHGIAHLRHKPGRIWQSLIGEVSVLVSALLAGIILAKIERRAFGAYGLPKRGVFGGRFWVGAIWGLAWITILLLFIRATGDFSFGRLALHGIRLLKFAAFWALLFLVVGLFEEFLFRGYTQFTLTQVMGFWPAALLLSAIFGAVHLGNNGEALLGALAAALIGLFFCLTLRRTGALWFAVGFHAAWDWGESYLYSVPDSGQVVPSHLLSSSFHGSRWLTGGTVGPEGSVLIFPLLLLLWLVFDRVYPHAKFNPHPAIAPELTSTHVG